MPRVTILALENAVASSVMGTMDIFSQVGVTYNFSIGAAPSPRFDVEIVTLDGEPVSAFNNTPIIPHRSAAETETTDLVVVSSFMAFETLSTSPKKTMVTKKSWRSRSKWRKTTT